MPKAEKGTPKDIANRIKAKGLQKLKFYCQMCQKQCRDQNGFKCHLTSESHLRQMKIFSGNATGIVDGMSKEFESSYMETLRRRHGTKRVNANNVYQEVIQDRHHIHMNATKWATLTDFVQYLGKMGKCVVEETERGWYVQYIERDAGILARQEAQQRLVEAEKESEQRLAKQMEIQRVEAAKALDRAGGTLHAEATKLERSEHAAITLALGSAASKKKKKTKSPAAAAGISSVLGADDEDEESEEETYGNDKEKAPPAVFAKPPREQAESKPRVSSDHDAASRKRPRVEEAEATSRSDSWLRRDIMVRIISKKLAGGRYYKRKAVVDRVLDDKFTAEVEVLDSCPDERDGGDILRLDQDDLETVVPKEGKKVRILKGRFRGERAKVVSLDKKTYQAVLKLEDGTVLERVDYEDFSKLA
jgi:DNA/RNA-binding protein KIN17